MLTDHVTVDVSVMLGRVVAHLASVNARVPPFVVRQVLEKNKIRL